eukprot:1626289-Pleurochrysis_carterae.AAC.6
MPATPSPTRGRAAPAHSMALPLARPSLQEFNSSRHKGLNRPSLHLGTQLCLWPNQQMNVAHSLTKDNVNVQSFTLDTKRRGCGALSDDNSLISPCNSCRAAVVTLVAVPLVMVGQLMRLSSSRLQQRQLAIRRIGKDVRPNHCSLVCLNRI